MEPEPISITVTYVDGRTEVIHDVFYFDILSGRLVIRDLNKKTVAERYEVHSAHGRALGVNDDDNPTDNPRHLGH
ncbi:hypothetical protein R4P47_08160 [Rhodococcus sp. IEGM 1370]|uniref:hypothetical protein n=1 Tax=Rhodococcus sp. IEGM 1370 TaxID=3082222 RepID=UPI002954BC49|nr:hypothetical protein [Rhodococcus sp. IEGM 1370]MDV8076528.1 hypothetical protein [Rhodococcus sp. IEGM 1370]